MNDKILINGLITDRIEKLTDEERQEVVLNLLETYTQQQLADKIGVSKTTIFDWKSLRQKGRRNLVSFNNFYVFLLKLKPKDITDWNRLEQIKDLIEKLLDDNLR